MSDVDAMLYDVTRRLFAQHAESIDHADGRDLPDDLWMKVEEIGLPLALVPESAGGGGLSFSEAAPLFAETGRAAMGAPLAETMLGAAMLARAGIAIPAGMIGVAPVREDETVALSRTDAGWHVRGTLTRVPSADVASGIVVAVEHEGESYVLLLDPAECGRRSGANLAGQARDTLSMDMAVRDEAVGRLPGPARLTEHGAAIRTAQIAGALDDLIGLTAQYARDRVQFGRPIGKFQAVQHLVATLAGHVAVAVAAADLAAEAIDGFGDRLDIAIAKAAASSAAGEGAAIAHQVFGAIGVTREHRLHRTTLRLLSWRDEFGGEARLHAAIGQAAFATGGGPALWARMAR